MAEVSIPSVDEAVLELVEWAEGRRSWTNAIMEMSPDRAVGLAMSELADAAATVKRAALVVALIEREKYLRGLL